MPLALPTVEDFANGASNFQQAITNIGANPVTLAIYKEYTIEADLDLHPNTHLMFVGGAEEKESEGQIQVVHTQGKLKVDEGKTLRVYSPSCVESMIDGPIFGGTVSFQKAGTAQMLWWGNDYAALRVAISVMGNIPSTNNSGGVVVLPGGSITIPSSGNIPCRNRLSIEGTNTLLDVDASRTAPLFVVSNASDFFIKDLGFELNGGVMEGAISFTGNSSHVTVDSCFFRSGKIGILTKVEDPVDPEEPPQKVEYLTISNCSFSGMETSIFLGDPSEPGITQFVELSGNTINGDNAGSEIGIRLGQNASDIIIDGNTITGNGECGILSDFSPGGVIITANIIAKNDGDGIKALYNATEDSRRFIISANSLRENGSNGILLTTTGASSATANHFFEISDNKIISNVLCGVYCLGMYINISGNQIIENAKGTGDESGVYINGNNILVSNNTVVNNGNATSSSNTGILVESNVSTISILGNNVSLDTNLPNAFQDVGINIKNNTTRILLKNNLCRHHPSNSNLVLSQSAEVTGETVVCEVGTLVHTNTVEMPMYTALTNTLIFAADFVNGRDIPTTTINNEPLETLSVRNRGVNGAGTDLIFEKKSDIAPQIKKFEADSMPFVTNPSQYIEERCVLTFLRTPASGGSEGMLLNAKVVLHFVTF